MCHIETQAKSDAYADMSYHPFFNFDSVNILLTLDMDQ